MKKAGKDTLDLVNDLLDISQLNSGELSVNAHPINVEELIQSSIRVNKCLAMKSNINLKANIEDNMPLVSLDPKRMKQILTNLVSNSIKYSPRNTEIEIQAHFTQDGVKITVCDQGFGMSEEEVKVAIKKYGVLDNPNKGKVDSFGIGLHLIQNLIESQNGNMSIKSQKNSGTEISMEFNSIH